MKKALIAIPFCFLFLMILSCESQECGTTNDVFRSSPVGSQEYVMELKKQLSNAANLSYWVKDYKRINDKDLLLISIKGEDLCAEGLLFVQNSPELQVVIYKKAKSYKGAQILGLKYSFKKFKDGKYSAIQEP